MKQLVIGSFVAVVLAACSSAPPQRVSAPAAKPQATAAKAPPYRRSYPEAPPVPGFKEFGSLQGNILTLAMNPTLAAEQARVVCEKKVTRDEPPYFEQVDDCYRVALRPERAGDITVVAVREGMTPKEAIGRSQAVAPVNLPADGAPMNVTLPTTEKNCWALQSNGKLINLRSSPSAPDQFFFLTPADIAARRNAALDIAVAQKQDALRQHKTDMEKSLKDVRTSPAWKNQQCVLPASPPTPPMPKFMPADVMDVHTRGFCLMALNDQVRDDLVGRAARAKQKYSYIRAAQALKWDPSRAAECTNGYRFDAASLAYLRGQAFQDGLGRARNAEEGVKAILEGILVNVTVTEERQYDVAMSMLESCQAFATRSCRAPQAEWERSVNALLDAPRQAHESCQRNLQEAADAAKAVKTAERELTLAKTAAEQRWRMTDLVLPLSEASCAIN